MRHLRRTHQALFLFTALAGANTARAQQFQQVTTLPGGNVWSEGVECADVDRDGDLDIFVADGDGFSSAGTQRQNKLLINQTVQGTPYGLADESVARLGTHTSNAKGVATADINADGWVDALFSNAFSTQLPFLYINQGVANPGFFTFEGSARGFTTLYSSGSASFADLDDDGDLDVIINDGYNAGAATRKPHLFFNDGAGFFTENAAALGSVNKASQMDVQFGDVDNDWDVDFLGVNKVGGAGGQYLLLNNGTGTFSDSSSLLTASSSAYEAEIADLDGDQDLDLFYISLSGFAEGAVRNNIVPSGTLSFTNQSNLGTDDDNEAALFDYDMDEDYDVFIGSLGPREKIWRNNGALAFTSDSTNITAQADSTLDMAVADLNNDGKYDLITVQGESGNFTDKYYKNTGAADAIPPRLVSENVPLSFAASGPFVVKAKVRDQVLDDGINYVTGSVSYVVRTSLGNAAVTINAGAFSPASITIAPGTLVTWTNASGAPEAVDLNSAPYDATSGSIAVGGTYSYAFIAPGAYTYASSGGAFTGSVNVSGAVNTADGLHAGGQIYRFQMNDTAAGAGVQVCYELRFRDWPGNTLVTRSRCVALTGGGSSTLFCFGDGTGTACPCGNNSPLGSGAGCLNSLGQGGVISAVGTSSLSADTVVLNGSGMPNSSALYFQGTAQAAGGFGTVFGDGLRCAGGSIVRLGTKINVAGASSYPTGGDLSVSVKGLIGAPGTRTYQVWYRNAAAFCTSDTFNLTNGVSLSWVP